MPTNPEIIAMVEPDLADSKSSFPDPGHERHKREALKIIVLARIAEELRLTREAAG